MRCLYINLHSLWWTSWWQQPGSDFVGVHNTYTNAPHKRIHSLATTTTTATTPNAAVLLLLQVTTDASSDAPVEQPLLEGGSTPEERQASFLELALCLAAGLPDAALDPLFVVGVSLLMFLVCFLRR